MDQLIPQIIETARAMWRRRWLGLGVAWLVAVIGALALTVVPDRYEASARVYVDTKSVLRPLMHDLAVEPDLEQTVGLLARTLITRPNIEVLMQRTKLDRPDMTAIERDRMVEGLSREIKIASSGRDNVFNFSFRDTDPDRARFVVENLVSLFLESDSGSKRRDSEGARDFIDSQIKSYESRLAEAENRLKEFKLRNLDVTDTSGKDYFARMTALTEDMSKLSVELRAAEQSRDAIRHELDGETVSLVPEEPTSAFSTQVPEIDARLDAARKQLDELLRRYTDEHPDVIAAKHLIARLEDDKQRELAKRSAAAAKAPKSLNRVDPVQQQVKLALAESEANVASLRVRAGDMQARLAQLRASATRVPQIEAEMAQLNRDYDVLRATYQTMVARREKAALSEDVDGTRSSQFRVIDPPHTAPRPVFPNRVALAPVIVVLALLAGIASTFVAVQLLPTFDNSRTLQLSLQRPSLGSVSMLVNDGTLRAARTQSVRFASGLAGLVLLSGLWIAWVSMQTVA